MRLFGDFITGFDIFFISSRRAEKVFKIYLHWCPLLDVINHSIQFHILDLFI